MKGDAIRVAASAPRHKSRSLSPGETSPPSILFRRQKHVRHLSPFLSHIVQAGPIRHVLHLVASPSSEKHPKSIRGVLNAVCQFFVSGIFEIGVENTH